MRRSPGAPLDPPKQLGHGKCDTYNKGIQLDVATNYQSQRTSSD
jgi:DNA repair protein REV1